MHAGWNLLARFNHAERAFYYKMLVLTLVAGFIPAVWTEISTRSMTSVAWWCVAGSGFCAALYLFFLARAYETSDFTVVYPVARVYTGDIRCIHRCRPRPAADVIWLDRNSLRSIWGYPGSSTLVP